MSTAIKERESRLVESERQLRNLFERVEHAIFRLDADGDIIRTNRKFDELCGGKDKFFLLFSKEREGRLLKRAASGELKNVEERILDKDGNELRVIMSVYPELDEKSNVTAYDGYFVDITGEKKLEESLVQAQKMESIGKLAGGIAHDFNNILAGILGYASLMKSLTPETDKNYRYIDIVEKSAERAANFTQQLVDFARKGKYIVVKLSVNDIVRELPGFLRGTFDRNISLIVDIEENLPSVEGDSNQLYQAIMNLCINARDTMPGGGELSIKTDSYRLDDEKVVDFFRIPPGVYVRISIADTGDGMTPEVKKRIFEPFYTTKDVGKGTGLGLAVVYGIVKNHGGYIEVLSEPGLGTTVSISLPEAQGTTEEQKEREIGEWKTQKGTILLIDDEEVIRDLVKDILEACNYNVLSAVHGNEGIKIFDENKDRIDLVILDMVMPEKNGRQTFQELKAMSADVKILLCSGYEQEMYFQELFEAGASGLLRKPFQHSELIEKVRKTLEG
jgi:PAS domain S-box-containing protein